MRIFTISAKRVANLTKGKSLSELEKRGKVAIKIKNEGEYAALEIEGESEAEWVSEHAIKAIDLGFTAKQALKLFGDDTYLEILDLGEAMHYKANAVKRMKARIIGSEGRIKKTIEELTDASLAISDDDRVGFLGDFNGVKAAKEAVLRLLEGKQHGGVIAYLRDEKRKRDASDLGIRI